MGEGADEVRDIDLLRHALTQLPAGHAVTWGDTHMRLTDTVWRASWIDVQVPELDGSLKWRWTWTIVTPEDGDAPAPGEESCVIPVAPDCTVLTYLDPDTHWYSTSGPLWVGKAGESPPQEVLHATSARGEPVEVPGWSLDTVNQALSRWCHEHAGRGDLRFVFDDAISLGQSAQAAEELEKAKDSHSEDMYQVDEGMYATGEFVDTLLAMPQEEAAGVMRQIKHVLGGFREGNGIDFPR